MSPVENLEELVNHELIHFRSGRSDVVDSNKPLITDVLDQVVVTTKESSHDLRPRIKAATIASAVGARPKGYIALPMQPREHAGEAAQLFSHVSLPCAGVSDQNKPFRALLTPHRAPKLRAFVDELLQLRVATGLELHGIAKRPLWLLPVP